MYNWAKLGIDVTHIRREGKTKCPKCGPTRKHKHDKSLSVNVVTGVYNCHNSPCDFSGSLSENFLQNQRPKREYTKPLPRLQLVSDRLLNWFEKERKISNNTLLTAKVTYTPDEWMPQDEKKHSCCCFNYYRGDELVNIKFRTGGKDFKMAKDAELIFYNLNSVRESSSDFVIIVEGEIDCLTFIECGIYRVISVPNGANQIRPGQPPRLEYLDNCWNDIAGISQFIIAVDGDETGTLLQQELIRRLGAEKCWTITYPQGTKDANEVLVKYGKNAVIDMVRPENLKQVPIEGIMTMDDLEAQADYIYNHGYPATLKLGWKLDEYMTWLLGDTTVITGIPNHGKSTFFSNVVVELAERHNWVWAIFSPEKNRSAFMVTELANILVGLPSWRANPHDKMPLSEWNRAKDFIRSHFLFVKTSGIDLTLDGLLNIGDKMVSRYGINGYLIDPWNYVETDIPPGQTETVWLGNQLGKLSEWAKAKNVHVAVVAHPTKMPRDNKTKELLVPSLYDISGSAHWNNKIDNGLCVYRNFKDGTTTVYVHKVRWFFVGQGGGSVRMKFEKSCQRFRDFDELSPEQQAHEDMKANKNIHVRSADNFYNQPKQQPFVFDQASTMEAQEEAPF